MVSVMLKDAREVAIDSSIPWEMYAGKSIVVTGATGLIGTALVASLVAREELFPTGMRVACLVRDVACAINKFGEAACLRFFEWHAEEPAFSETNIPDADYIFHCASMTGSSDFLERPVEVICTTVGGATAMLDLADKTGAKLCFLSTMEVYGEVVGGAAIVENSSGSLDTMLPRNSYPEAKRLVEALCAAYAAERGTSAIVLRLCQTMGPGVRCDDQRVFAEFARCVIQGCDIVLLTDGTKCNQYLYTADAARAILVSAALGESGTAYNAANEATFCSVREMAEMVVEWFGGGKSRVRIEADSNATKRFRNGSTLRLDTSRLKSLGWFPTVGLEEMYRRMIEGWDNLQH